MSYPDYEYFRKNNHVFTDIAAAPNSIGLNVDFEDDGREVKLATRPVSENYFAVLGIKPFLGRFFTAGETAESTDEAVMSWPCWKRLGSKRDIIGKKLAGWTIVGVAPPSFTGGFYGANGDLFGSLRHDQDRSWMADRSQGHLMLTARLKPGTTREQATGGDGGPGGAAGERVSKGRQGEDGGGDAGDATAAGCDSGPDGGERSSDASGAAGAVDCVRERGEPDAGGGYGTAAGSGDQAGDRGAAGTLDSRVSVGERGAVRGQRRLGLRHGGGGGGVAERISATCFRYGARFRFRSTCGWTARCWD